MHVTPHAVREHKGTCDASAAVALGSGMFVAASDEDNALRLYARDLDGPPVAEADVSEALDLKPGEESDIEAGAWLGKRIYWITSHDRKARGDRYSFFATRVDFVDGHPRVKLSGCTYHRLLRDIFADDRLAIFNLEDASLRDPKEDGGLNIEGLGRARDDQLYIGLRNPIREGRAILLRLKNPKDVVLDGKKCRFAKPVTLDLDGLGIRSIDHCAARDSILIVAGPHDARGDFRLFEWTGKRRDAPVELMRFSPTWYVEALLCYPGDGAEAVHVVSDDGRRQIGGCDCKLLPVERQRFRSGTVALPPLVRS